MTQYNINNRRYVGSKHKLSDWIIDLILLHCKGDTFFDVFAGTSIMSQKMLSYSKNIIINDLLYSNEIIYKAFFDSNHNVSHEKLMKLVESFNTYDFNNIEKENYFSDNFGHKYFSHLDAYKIGEIREQLNQLYYVDNELNDQEFNILLSSLLYSMDKIANTVGHYDAYRKINNINNKFEFNLIKPLDTTKNNITIYREDANELVKKIKNIDIAFIDPPYNSRQYSRFYHLLENIVQWNKPELYGVALKPKPENMSEYCKVAAKQVFEELINDLDSKYIVVTYNNTYNSKSNSSRNKIDLEELESILSKKGKVKVFDTRHNCFNTGKTDFNDHREYLYIVEVV